MKKALGVLLLASLGLHAMGQITQRERPAEWKNLTEGGRFMDRILPMSNGKTGHGLWGTAEVQNRFIDNGLEQPGMSFWGGNILKDAKGTYHMFVAGWPENSPNGHMFWSNSTVYHATCDNPIGPFRVIGSIGKGHNPEAYQLGDGRIIVYVIDGYYIANSLNSPVWTYGKFQFDPRDRKIIEGLSNLTFTRRQDGSFLMVCRGGGIWISRDGLSTWEQISDHRVYPPIDGRFEDPVVWRDSLQYHLIVNDWLGRIAYYERSLDGLHWIVEPGEAYLPGCSVHPDGQVEHWFKYERPKIRQDKQGRACQINFAVIDTIKWEDHPNDRHSSKNISIPLNPGMQMEITNAKPITNKTKHINLLIKGEEGFNPQKDLDISSLRFGSFQEVDYGRGAKVVRTQGKGNDLLLTFPFKGTGIDAKEWAPKLIGKKKKEAGGNMVFGYARRPDIDYEPMILSARRPTVDSLTQKVSVEIKNYGIKASQPVEVEVIAGNRSLGKMPLTALKPYQTYTLKTDATATKESPFIVRFLFHGKVLDENQFM